MINKVLSVLTIYEEQSNVIPITLVKDYNNALYVESINHDEIRHVIKMTLNDKSFYVEKRDLIKALENSSNL